MRAVDFLAEATQLKRELSDLRRAFHRRPELGNREFRTAERIEAALRELGIPSVRLLDTAVAGRLDFGRPGPVAALRADMDALPLPEASGADFASENPGVTHACGHDVHMTAVLGAAKLLAAHRDELSGAAVFLFQPDEEGRGGAERMIGAGALEGVDAVFGGHVAPDLPAGTAGVRYGKFYAASDTFRLIFHGRSAHGAQPELGVDALAAGAAAVARLRALPRVLDGEKCVLTVGTFRSGTAENVVADRAELTGMMRTLGPVARKRMRELLTLAAEEAAEDCGARAEVLIRESYPGVVNDDAMTELVRRTAAAVLGEDRVAVIEEPSLTTDDFGCFLLQRPGSYYHIGAGCPLPLHNPAFLPDEDAAVTMAALHASVVEAFLRAGRAEYSM